MKDLNTARIVDWHGELEQLEATPGADVPFAIFPLRPFSYSETDPARSVRPPINRWCST